MKNYTKYTTTHAFKYLRLSQLANTYVLNYIITIVHNTFIYIRTDTNSHIK